PELEEDLLYVRLDGPFGDEEPRRDRLVGKPFGNEAQNLALAPRQLGERISAAATADQARNDRRIDDRLAVGDSSQRVDEDRDVVDLGLAQQADDALARQHRVVGDDYAHGISAARDVEPNAVWPPSAPMRSATWTSGAGRGEPSSSTVSRTLRSSATRTQVAP